MKEIWIYLEKHRREFPSSTPVRSIAYNDREELERYQVKPDLLQVGLRLSSPVQSICNRLGDGEYVNHFPHVVIKHPGMICRIDQPTWTQAFYFTYNLSAFKAFRARQMLTGPAAWDITISPRIRFLMGELIHQLDHSNDYGAVDRIDQMALLLFQELLLLRDHAAHESDEMKRKIMQLASYLQVHYREKINFERLSRQFGLSRRSLFRYWAEYCGNTPGQYVTDLKMKEAEYLLLDTRKNIEDIGGVFDFSSAYFCALFKKTYGCTPLQFRRAGGNISPRKHQHEVTS